jgi:hypothetical protein
VDVVAHASDHAGHHGFEQGDLVGVVIEHTALGNARFRGNGVDRHCARTVASDDGLGGIENKILGGGGFFGHFETDLIYVAPHINRLDGTVNTVQTV